MHYRARFFRSFPRESFTLVCLEIIKRGDPVGDRRSVSLFHYIYSNKSYLSSTSDVVVLQKMSRPSGRQHSIFGRISDQ